MSWTSPKSTQLVQVSSSEEVVVFERMGERDRMLVAERSKSFCEWILHTVFGAAIYYLHTLRFWSLSIVFSVFVGLYKKTLCFSDSFVQKKIQQPDGSCDVGFYKNFSRNSLLKSAKKNEKQIVIREYCMVLHDDKMCFLPNCRYHIKLIGDCKKLLRKLDVFCFNYQHLDCLYTLFNYRLSGISVVKSEQAFGNRQRAVQIYLQNREMDKMPNIARKRLLRKK